MENNDSNKKHNSGLVILVIVAVVAIVLAIFQSVSVFSQKTKSAPKAHFKSTNSSPSIIKRLSRSKKDNISPQIPVGESYIARIFIRGTIEDANATYNQEWLLETISDLKDDEDNVAIILFIDSPGGAVYQADEVYLALVDYRDSGKGLYTYMGSLAASGGYYIACPSEYIMANRNTLTGSIGVISGQFLDLTELMEKYGVKSTTIHSGKNKTMGSYTEPFTEEQKQIMQSISDECYEQFTGIVSKERGLSLEKVYNLADGRIYTAKQAKENGLIDGIGTWEEMVELVDRKFFDFNNYQIVDFSYERTESIYSYLWGLSKALKKSESNSGLPEILENALTPKTPFPAYYYDSPF